MSKLLEDIKEQHDRGMPLSESAIDHLIAEAELQRVELEMRRKYESFLKSIIRSGETISDSESFEWFIR